MGEPCLGQLWASLGAPAHLAPSAGAVQHGGCGSQLARGLFLVESFDTGEKFAGLNPPPSHSPQHWQICSGSAGKSRSQHPWDTARARAAFQAWELCTPVTEGLKQGGKERKKERRLLQAKAPCTDSVPRTAKGVDERVRPNVPKWESQEGSTPHASALRTERHGGIKDRPLGSENIPFSSPTRILHSVFWAIAAAKQHNKDHWNTCKDQTEERAKLGASRSFRLGEASAADIRQPLVWETAFVLPRQGCHSWRDAPAAASTPQGSAPLLLLRES